MAEEQISDNRNDIFYGKVDIGRIIYDLKKRTKTPEGPTMCI